MKDSLQERRHVEQIPVYDRDGRIDYYKIPNYKLRNEFLTNSERTFYRSLINVVKKLNEEYKDDKRPYFVISTQVALNRIVDINNERNSNLYDEIKNKSVDFVVYNLNSGKIICCIELDGKEHKENEKRIERDKLLSKMLDDLVDLTHININNNYDEEYLLKKIKLNYEKTKDKV